MGAGSSAQPRGSVTSVGSSAQPRGSQTTATTVVSVSPKKTIWEEPEEGEETEPEASSPAQTESTLGLGAGTSRLRLSQQLLKQGSDISITNAPWIASRPSASIVVSGNTVRTSVIRESIAENTDSTNKELETLLLQTNWSAIYQLFHQRFNIGELGHLEKGFILKSSLEMTLSIVAKCFALLRSDPHGRLHCTPLHIAALQSSAEAAEVIIRDLPELVTQTHVSTNKSLCPLHIAILTGDQTLVELLLEGQASPNVRTIHDVCPLHLAATTSKELCQILLSYNATPTQRDVMGSNAVHYAASFKQQRVLELLLSNPQSSQRLATDADQKRITPLHIACALLSTDEDLAAPMALMASGAKPWQADVSGATPPELVGLRSSSALLERFFEACGNQPQSAAQRWLEDRRDGVVEKAGATDEGGAPSDEAVSRAEEAPSADLESCEAPSAIVSGGKVASPCSSLSGFADLTATRRLELQREEEQKAADVANMKQELSDAREQLLEMEKLRRELEHSKEKCAMWEQASLSQQKVFEDLQALCNNATSQHQLQIEDMRQRYALERDEWEERHRGRVEAVREDAQKDLARQLEQQQRHFEAQHDLLRAQLHAAEAGKMAAEVRAESAMVEAAATVKLGLTEEQARPVLASTGGTNHKLHSSDGDGVDLHQRILELQQEVLLARESRAKDNAVGGHDQELSEGLRCLCTRHGLMRLEESLNPSNAELTLLARVEAELLRLQQVCGEREMQIKGLQERVQQEQEEGARLRIAAADARDHCAALLLQVEEAKHQHSAHILQLEMRAKDVELDASQLLAKAQAEVDAYLRRAEAAEAYSQQVQPRVDRLNEQLRGLEVQFQEEQALRKRYHNQIQDIKGAIRVFCRFRPLVKQELELGQAYTLRQADAFTVELMRHASLREAKTFTFDAVFGPDSTQQEIFSDCRELVQSAVDGFNVTIFAYGQTGAGKTHTMYGSEEDPGLAPRSIQALYDVIRSEEQRGQKTFNVKAHMVEVYKQEIIDLLSDKPKARGLDVRRDLAHGMMYVDGAVERQVCCPQDLKAVMMEGESRRRVTVTRLNSSSSRSHLLFSIIIECYRKDTEQHICGKITLCDLAGSERPKKSEVSGEALREAIEINKSLSSLGDVIEALTKGSKSVPYRNHRLTMLMQDSLGGSAKTLMFVNCSPALSNFEETHTSLKWASRARQVTNEVKKNADSKEVARLKNVIKMMSQAQNAQEGGGRDTAQDVAALRAGMGMLAQ